LNFGRQRAVWQGKTEHVITVMWFLSFSRKFAEDK